MVNLFRLGSHRLLSWSLLLIPLTIFADFTSSDSQVLSSMAALLDDIHRYSGNMQINITDISGDTSAMSSDVDEIRRYAYYTREDVHYIKDRGLYHITNALHGIWQSIETDYQHHMNTPSESIKSIYVHDVRTDDIYDKLVDIQQSINNLTNYLCYSPDYPTSVISAINTNLFALLFSPVVSFEEARDYLDSIYSCLYGMNPTDYQLDDLESIYFNSGFLSKWQNIAFLLGNPSIDFDGVTLPDSDMTLREVYDEMWGNIWSNPYPGIDSVGELYYQEYGTKKLTDVSIGISNLVANITNGFYDVTSGGYFEEDTSPNGHGFKFGRVVYDSVSSVTSDAHFTDEVNTNVVGSVWSNKIDKLTDSGYETPLNRLRESTPEDFADLSGILSEISTAQGAIEESLNLLDADHNNDYVIPLRYTASRLGEVDLSLTLPNVSSRTLPVVQFLAHFLQIAIALYFFRVAWAKIVATVNFYNEPDPF